MQLYDEALKIGDVVIDRNGTPMTVDTIENKKVSCIWFDEQDQLHEGKFKIEELTLKN